MRDPRGPRLAEVIVRHSIRLAPGESVLIESYDLADGLVLDLIEAVQAAGALPLVHLRSNAVIRSSLVRARKSVSCDIGPKPVQRNGLLGGPPVLIGGMTPAAPKRAGRLVLEELRAASHLHARRQRVRFERLDIVCNSDMRVADV